MWPIQQGGKAGTGNYFEGTQVLDLADKDFKAVITNMFKELKKSLPRELNGDTRTISLPVKNIGKKIRILKVSQIEILELKIITEIKTPQE